MHSEAPNSVRNHFWSFFGAKEVFGVCLEPFHGTSEKSEKYFPHLCFFWKFLAISRRPEGQLIRGNENNFFWCRKREISGSKVGSHAR